MRDYHKHEKVKGLRKILDIEEQDGLRVRRFLGWGYYEDKPRAVPVRLSKAEKEIVERIMTRIQRKIDLLGSHARANRNKRFIGRTIHDDDKEYWALKRAGFFDSRKKDEK